MKALLTFLFLLHVAAAAEPQRIPFALPELLPLTVTLVLPGTSSVTAHDKIAGGDSIRAAVDEASATGMLIQVSAPDGKPLWSHDFGFNASTPSGNTIDISYQPKTRLLLVNYYGYKWDHHHKLLLLDPNSRPPSIREYATAEKDILPLLKRQKDFPSDYHYGIQPFRFTDQGVEFQCIPHSKPERQSAHPFAQDQPWYDVVATLDPQGKMIPGEIKISH